MTGQQKIDPPLELYVQRYTRQFVGTHRAKILETVEVAKQPDYLQTWASGFAAALMVVVTLGVEGVYDEKTGEGG